MQGGGGGRAQTAQFTLGGGARGTGRAGSSVGESAQGVMDLDDVPNNDALTTRYGHRTQTRRDIELWE